MTTNNVFIIIFILITIGAVLEYTLTIIDRQRYPPPGKMIDVGGLRLHLLPMGEQQDLPTVILESGTLGFSAKWDMVQREVAHFARVYSYDRAGYGWSDDPQRVHPERNDQTIVQELHELIVKAEIPTPCILVGHAIGSQYVCQFARLYPDLVAGIVLLDPFHPLFWASRLQGIQDMLTTRLLSFIGLVRLETWFRYYALPLSPSAKHACVGLHSHAMQYSATREIKLLEPDVKIENILGSKPVVVVIKTLAEIPQWKEIQSDFLKLSANSQLIQTIYSGPIIYYDNPKIVVKGIRLAVESARSGKPLTTAAS